MVASEKTEHDCRYSSPMFHAQRPCEAAFRLSPSQDTPPAFVDSSRSVAPGLSLRNLRKSFDGHEVVSGVSIDVPRGSIFGVIGRSGAGKTTLLRMAALLECAGSGEVLYGSDRVSGLEGKELLASRRRAGVVFQSFNLFSSRTAAGNVAFPLEAAGVNAREIRDRVTRLLDLVGLPDKAERPVGRLSGGERQRVAIARALANEPEILFCDEATSALDPGTTRSVLDLIGSLRDRLGLTVLMVTHQMEVVRRACDYVAVLDAGQVAESGGVAELFANPRSRAGRHLVEELRPDEAREIEEEGGSPRFRLRFEGDSASRPILSMLSRSFPVEANIMSGTIHDIRGRRSGELVVELAGEDAAVAEAKAWLVAQGVAIEEVGHA